MATIFEKIISREIPADIVYEDDAIIAFLDIRPVNHGHTLVVPKQPCVNVFDAEPETFRRMAEVAQRIARSLREITGCDGVNITMNNGEAAGQEVPHAHIHVIPRFSGDSAFLGVRHLEYDTNEAGRIREALVSQLES